MRQHEVKANAYPENAWRHKLASLSMHHTHMTNFVNASLFRFSKLWPVSAPFSLFFIAPRDCRVGNTASLSYSLLAATMIQSLAE